MRDGPPDHDAYERVTNPERFRPVHGAADALVTRLESDYQVERNGGDDAGYEGVTRQVELVPSVGAPLVVRWNDFPGISVRYGRWHDEHFPQCGCDACDEQPEELIRDLERKIAAVVRGRFTEAVVTDSEGTWLTFEFRYEGGRSCGKGRLRQGHPLRNEPGEIIWPAWPLRNGSASGGA